jgi:hypothetical protein
VNWRVHNGIARKIYGYALETNRIIKITFISLLFGLEFLPFFSFFLANSMFEDPVQ